jgi:hypothetical protein
METTINYFQTACGITIGNKNITTWKRLHYKKCSTCSNSITINKGLLNINRIDNSFDFDSKIAMNNDKNKFGNI